MLLSTPFWIFLVTLPTLLLAELEVYRGEYNYSSYYQGNSPIIILSQHGGYTLPDNTTIPDRHDGCWNGTDCIWTNKCEQTSGFDRDSSNCGVKTLRDAFTREISVCLRENTILFPNRTRDNITLYPHLVINELHRIKLDANREFGEATLNNNIAANTYDEIHNKWMQYAKDNATNQCGWGLVFDIHGQAVNSFNQLGYRISQSQLLYNDGEMQEEIDSTSIRSLAEYRYNYFNTNLSEIIRGNYSLGNYLNNTKYGQELVVPSLLQPDLGDFDDTGLYYYQGGFGVLTHGSQNEGNVDAIQIEVNRPNRWNETLRNQFCQQFSQSIIQFVYHWYNVSNCTIDPEIDNNDESNEPTMTMDTTSVDSGMNSTEIMDSTDMSEVETTEYNPSEDDVGFQNKLNFFVACVAPCIVVVTVFNAFV